MSVRLAVVALLACALAPAPGRAAASPWAEHEVVATRLVAAPPAADGTLRLGLHVRLAPGWHVYWRHGGDAGLPPEVTLASDPALAPAELLFPAPRRYDLRGGLVAIGYDGEVVYPLRARPPVGAQPPRRVSAAVDYLACEEECIPFHDDLVIDLPGGEAEGGAEAALLAAWEARLPAAAERVPRLRLSASYQGDAAGGDLLLRLAQASASTTTPPQAEHAAEDHGLRTPPDPGAAIDLAPDLFVAPMAGVVVGVPRAEPASDGESLFRVSLRPETAGGMPPRLAVEWTATGVVGAGAAAAVAGTAEVALTAATAPGASSPGGTVMTLLRGAALALTPSCLAPLYLLARAPRRRGAPLAPLLAAAGLTLALTAATALGRLAGIALPLAEPVAIAGLALLHLALALALWWRGETVTRLVERPWSLVLLPLLALPYVPVLLGASATLAPLDLTALAAGFALVVAAAAAWPGASETPGSTPDNTPLDTPLDTPSATLTATPLRPLLGFLPAVTLLWITWRLAEALPSSRVALLQLGWVAAALGLHLALGSGPRGRWLAGATAAACAVATVWLAA